MFKRLNYFIVFLLLFIFFVSKVDANDLYFSTSEKNYSSNIINDGWFLKYKCDYTTKVFSSWSVWYNSLWYAIKKSDNISRSNIRKNNNLTNKNSYDVLPRTWYPHYFYISLSYKNLLTKTDLWYADIKCNNWGSCQLFFTWDPSNQDTTWMKNNTTLISLDTHDVVYNTYAYPCVIDFNWPQIVNKTWTSESKIEWQSWFKFITYDWIWTSTGYWFSGYNYSVTWLNYQTAPNNVDNQNGVNSWTIKVILTCTWCQWSDWTSRNGVIELTGWSNLFKLKISDWNWSNDKNALTWDSKRRWYDIVFTWPAYEVEKPVNVHIIVNDNPTFDPYSTVTWHNWRVNTGESNITFNNAVPPKIALSGEYSQISPNKTNPIVLDLTDEWAGIKTWSLHIWVSYSYTWIDTETNNEILINTWYEISLLSWNFVLYSGWMETWDAWCYTFTFNPVEDFPTNSTIIITWYVLDLAWNTWFLNSDNWAITTRLPCSEYWCSDIFYMWTWLIDSKLWFTWSVVQITWNRLESPYPHFESTDSGLVLMCGKDWSDITIATSGGVLIDWLNNQGEWYKYTWSELYITGLNYEIIDGIIVVSDD